MKRCLVAVAAGVFVIAFTYNLEAITNWPVSGFIADVFDRSNLNGPITNGVLSAPGVIVAALIAYRRRIPPNHCRKCGYNLTGNESGACPECGRLTDATP